MSFINVEMVRIPKKNIEFKDLFKKHFHKENRTLEGSWFVCPRELFSFLADVEDKDEDEFLEYFGGQEFYRDLRVSYFGE